MRRQLIAVLALALPLVAACGDDEPTAETDTSEPLELASTDLDDVEVSGEPGLEPTLEFPTPFGVTETDRRVLEEGDGELVADGALVTMDFVFVSGRTSEVITSSYDADPAELVFEQSLMTGVYDGLDGVPSGSRVLVGVAPEDGLGADPSRNILDTDTVLMVADVLEVRIPLTRAEGESVPPVDGLPTVELASDGAPTVTVPDSAPPSDLVIQTLIVGEGPLVESSDAMTVHYAGVLWDTGEVFDSTWEDGTPTSVGMDEVIPGWRDGLVGQSVGSQVLLVVPPDQGYGETGSGDIPPGATLVFVIDILDAR